MSGCSRTTVQIADRGGLSAFGTLTDVEMTRWERVRDDISTALVRVTNFGPECSKMLAELHAGRHELLFFRDDARVWEGPVTRIGYHRDYVEIEARDVMHYAYRTIMHRAYKNAYPNISTVTERMRSVLRTELARKEALSPPVNILRHLDIRTESATAKTSRSTLPYQMTVWEDIDTMAARSGLDYTVIGRRIVGIDVHDVLGRIEVMTEADFQSEIVVTEYGMELATATAVTDGQGRWGAVGGIDPYYGEWEILSTSYEEEATQNTVTYEPPTTAELREQARRNASSRYPTPAIVRVPDGSLLSPNSTAIDVNTIVPGVRVPVRATLPARTVQQEQKLDRIRVEDTSEGETVAVTLSPAPGVIPDSWGSSGSDD